MSAVEVRVPEFVYYECFDPYATEAPREYGWPTPQFRKVGKGSQARYEVPASVACEMLEHASDFGEAMSYGVDDPSVGRRVYLWVERESQRLGLARYYELGGSRFRPSEGER